MVIATKDSIFGVQDLTQEEVKMEEWGGMSVLVWEMTGDEFGAYQSSLSEMRQEISQSGRRGKRDVKFVAESHIHRAVVELCFLTIKDKEGKRLFTTPEDKRKLGSKGRKALQRIYEVAERINGLDVDEGDEIPEVSEGKDSEMAGSES
jgi:hypothetical protein